VPGEWEVVVCGSCGAGVTRPDAGEAELAGYYPSGYGAYGATQGPLVRLISGAIRGWQAFLRFRTVPLEVLRTLPAGRALDVGCGRGDLGAALIARGWEVTGVEPSADACEYARGRGIDARRGGVADAGLEAGAYHAAILQHSLEHLTDPVSDLRRVAAALRPGGLLLVTVPHFGGWQRRRFGSRWYHLDLPRHRVHFGPTALRTAIEGAGLRLDRLDTSTSTVGLPATIQYALAGRCLFPTGLPLRVASGLCAATYPLARLLDRVGGGGDVLHAVATRP
jgi:SAM-dependent methyltransferase